MPDENDLIESIRTALMNVHGVDSSEVPPSENAAVFVYLTDGAKFLVTVTQVEEA